MAVLHIIQGNNFYKHYKAGNSNLLFSLRLICRQKTTVWFHTFIRVIYFHTHGDDIYFQRLNVRSNEEHLRIIY